VLVSLRSRGDADALHIRIAPARRRQVACFATYAFGMPKMRFDSQLRSYV